MIIKQKLISVTLVVTTVVILLVAVIADKAALSATTK